MRFEGRTSREWLVPVLVAGLLAGISACGRPELAGRHPYTPLFRKAAEAARAHPTGTIASAFAEAASANTLDDAARRWGAFLVRYPPDAETEDAVQKRYIDAARYELIRVLYLIGKMEQGDGLFEKADPLGLGG